VIERTFAVTGPAELDISVPSGSVLIERGGADQVEVYLETSDEPSWHVTQSGDTITVGHERFGFLRVSRARLRVTAPEGSSLHVATASATVRAPLRLGRVSASTASGDVHLEDVAELHVRTASGDVSVGKVDGDLTVKSASGDVRARSVAGRVSVTTASGDTSIEAAGGPLALSSASGDLRVGVYSGDDLEASTMSGDVAVGLVAGRRVKLSASTLSGSVRLPERRPAPADAHEGEVVSVRLKSVSGDLTLRRVG
jgi:DUF4097 and DUF4098 domain-containing protein YvlB